MTGDQGRYRSLSAPGRGTLRTPFVTLKFAEFEIPLLDAAAYSKDDPSQPIAPATLLLTSFNYTLSARMGIGNSVSITMLDPNWDYLERLASESGGEGNRKLFSFSFGWRGIDDQRLGLQGISFFLENIEIDISDPFKGAHITLRGIDQGIRLTSTPKSTTFLPATPISTVIKQVIEEADPSLEAEVDPIPTPVGDGSNRMENRTPMQYIRHLLDISKDAFGGNTFVWLIRPSSVAGRTKVVITSAMASLNKVPVRRYVYGRDRFGEMLSYRPKLEGAILLALGGGRATGIGIDPRTKTIVKVTSTQNEDPKLEPKRVHQTPTEDTKIHEVPWGSLDQIEGFVRGQRAKVDYFGYYAEAVVLGDISIQPFDQVEVLVLKTSPGGGVSRADANSVYNFASGIFRVESVEHVITAGTFQTNLTLFKNSGFVGEGEEGQHVSSYFKSPNTNDFGDVIVEVQPLRPSAPTQ